MTAKSKDPYPFKVGDSAIVRSTKTGKVVDSGFIDGVKPGVTIFKTLLGEGRHRFAFRRKGTEWIEFKKDHFRLESPPTGPKATAPRVRIRQLQWPH